MNNKFKFRAWCCQYKNFSYWTMTDLCTYATKDEKPSALDSWQQSTGLLDKNGKEIFEGDVANTSNGLAVIEYVAPSFEPLDLTGEYGYQPSQIEVIGNIYEHPDLLKKD
jgi:hypothetical protein